MPTLHDNIDSLKSGATRHVIGVSGTGLKAGATFAGHFAPSVIGVAVGVALSKHDHDEEMRRITQEYGKEIAARYNLRPSEVRVKHMEALARENPTIAEAVKRSVVRRNMSIAVVTVMVITSVALATFLAPIVTPWLFGAGAAGGMAEILMHGVLGFCGFMAGEKALDKYGEQKLGLKEPPVAQARAVPQLQSALSFPSQIRLLEKMQRHHEVISQEQVLTAFIKADPKLSERIQLTYRAPLEQLDSATRARAILEVGPDRNLEQLTADLNNRQIRAQELAFLAYGQRSGVPRLEQPKSSALRQAELIAREAHMRSRAKMGQWAEHVRSGASPVAQAETIVRQADEQSRQQAALAQAERTPMQNTSVSAAVATPQADRSFTDRVAASGHPAPDSLSHAEQQALRSQQSGNLQPAMAV